MSERTAPAGSPFPARRQRRRSRLPEDSPRPPRSRRGRWRRRLIVAVAGIVLVIAVVGVLTSGGSLPRPPRSRPVTPLTAAAQRLFAYSPAQAAQYVARAAVGNAHPLFTQSPGGAVATAARVARWRPLVDRAVAGTGIDPDLLEGMLFVESAGRPEVIAGSDPTDAAGLTQILAATGQSLLGMHINLARSRQLTDQIDAAQSGSRRGSLARLQARRATADQRFDPAAELAATVRYLQISERRFGRQDLAVESYHMGIGNLAQVLDDYDRGTAVPYAQLYFDSTPNRHRAAYRLLASLGDDSELYYWRVLAAVQVMRLYRSDRVALQRLAWLQTAEHDDAAVLHPPDRTPAYGDPAALAAAYQHGALVPLPSNAGALGIAVARAMGSGTKAPTDLYRGLRPVALRLLMAMADAVRTLSGARAPLELIGTVADRRYQRRELGGVYPPAATGYSFAIARHYANTEQADAFQAVLDRLQSLNLIAWAREPNEIQITVASDAASWLAAN